MSNRNTHTGLKVYLPGLLVSAPSKKPSAFVNCITIYLDGVNSYVQRADVHRDGIRINIPRHLIRTMDKNEPLDKRTNYDSGYYRVYGPAIVTISPLLR